MKKLTEIQQKIFDKVKSDWEKRVGIGKVDDDSLCDIIMMADTEGDGKKRVSVLGMKGIYLVPIENIILDGLKAVDIEKYPKVKED